MSQARNGLARTVRAQEPEHLAVADFEKLTEALQAMDYDPVVLRGGVGARDRAAALDRLQPQPGGRPLLVVATRPYAADPPAAEQHTSKPAVASSGACQPACDAGPVNGDLRFLRRQESLQEEIRDRRRGAPRQHQARTPGTGPAAPVRPRHVRAGPRSAGRGRPPRRWPLLR
jgi:hypothetical protein